MPGEGSPGIFFDTPGCGRPARIRHTVQKRLYGIRRVAFLFTGGDIRHAHAHLVPTVEGTDITSRRYIREVTLTFAEIPPPPHSELAEVTREIRAAMEEGQAAEQLNLTFKNNVLYIFYQNRSCLPGMKPSAFSKAANVPGSAFLKPFIRSD